MALKNGTKRVIMSSSSIAEPISFVTWVPLYLFVYHATYHLSRLNLNGLHYIFEYHPLEDKRWLH
jgi:hypothetical protein